MKRRERKRSSERAAAGKAAVSRRSTLGKLRDVLTPRERRRGLLVLLMMLLLALLETAGVASVMPFLAVLGNPAMIRTNPVLSELYRLGGFATTRDFLFALGIASFVVIVLSAILRIVTTYAMHRFIQMRRYSIAARLLQGYLRQPYEFFLNRNSADLSKTILSEVDEAVIHVLKPGMDLTSYGLISLVLVTLLVAVDPALALGVTIVVGGAYALIYLATRQGLGRMGKERVKANRARFTAASEAFGGIKDLKVLGREQAYLNRFREPAARHASHQARSATLAAVPKYLIEALGFGGLIGMALTLMWAGQDLGRMLPLLGLYAFAGFRLLPAAQHIYAGFSVIRFGLPALNSLHDDMMRVTATGSPGPTAGPPLSLREGVSFESVRFEYPGANRVALHDMDLTIAARTSVGFVGRTGAGKTTMGDLILGLLRPTSGRILIDGEPLTPDLVRRWQRTIGYVPQTIYLADASVSVNIAFGIEPGLIDQAAVERAARAAHIHDFVVEQLPSGYQTEIGERGVRLSGGQRQRIGIARALYHNPDLLVLDEATSALDTATERAVMEALRELSGEKTIVIIAHRMSTVRHCDQIVVLEEGRIRAAGRFDELEASSETFRQLAAI